MYTKLIIYNESLGVPIALLGNNKPTNRLANATDGNEGLMEDNRVDINSIVKIHFHQIYE